MSTSQIIEQLQRGNVEAVISALMEEEDEFAAWVSQQEQQQQSWEIARELSSSPELLEEIAW